MKIIEITKLENGAHRNQETNDFHVLPEGWAMIPDFLETENFPFGDIEIDVINNISVVTKWIPGELPEAPALPEEESVIDLENVSYDALAAAIAEGVNSL